MHPHPDGAVRPRVPAGNRARASCDHCACAKENSCRDNRMQTMTGVSHAARFMTAMNMRQPAYSSRFRYTTPAKPSSAPAAIHHRGCSGRHRVATAVNTMIATETAPRAAPAEISQPEARINPTVIGAMPS